MRSIMCVSLMASMVLLGVGCGASQTAAKSPVSADADFMPTEDDGLQANWAPPGELDFKVADVRDGKRAKKASVQAVSQPNKRDVKRGQIHAVSY